MYSCKFICSGHEEQYQYVRNAKKEQRVEELLQETRNLALQIQEEAFNDPNFDIAKIDTFMSRFQDLKHNLKRTGSRSSAPRPSKRPRFNLKGGVPIRKQVSFVKLKLNAVGQLEMRL